MAEEKKKQGILRQVAFLFMCGVLVTGMLTWLNQRDLSDDSVRGQIESRSAMVAEEVTLAVKEYPAYEWLLRYWHEHWNQMDIEYDVDFDMGTETEEKCVEFSRRHPHIQLRYANAGQINSLNREDQKLYAEIVYSWLITRVNQIKQTYNIDYLFCVMSDESFESQFFLFSGADPGAVRGTDYEEVYTLGVTSDVNESQQSAMRSAAENSSHLAEAGNYVDYYSYLCSIDEQPVLIGMTFSMEGIGADISRQTYRQTAFAMLHQIWLSLLVLAMIWYFVLRPLKKVQQNIRQYTQSQNSQEIIGNLAAIKSENEIGQLCEDVSSMVKEIDDHLDQIEKITAEKERIGYELTLANRIQSDILPNVFPAFPERREFEVYASMEPAREVGGDFYDFFMVDDDHLCLVIADVSGKGIPAALFMMASKIILANNAMMGKSPAKILADTNHAICSNNREEMFVTVWLGILELSTGILKAANAGHEYPAIRKPNGKFELDRRKHGFIIGAMEDVVYREYETKIEPGSKIFVYTDGLPEAADSRNRMFTTERMLEVLNRDPEAKPEEILKSIRTAVDSFVGKAEQFDDLTMMCVSYNGPADQKNA